MEVQGRSKIGRPDRRWLDRVTGDIKEKGRRWWKCATELHGGVSLSIDPHIKMGLRGFAKKKNSKNP